jgi:hypothetical protein
MMRMEEMSALSGIFLDFFRQFVANKADRHVSGETPLSELA